MVRPVRDGPSFADRTTQTASSVAESPGDESKDITSMTTRYRAPDEVGPGNTETCGVPSAGPRFPATARAISSGSGDAHRLNSSMETWLGPERTTIWGLSTISGTETGPTETEYPAAAAAGFAGGLRV